MIYQTLGIKLILQADDDSDIFGVDLLVSSQGTKAHF